MNGYCLSFITISGSLTFIIIMNKKKLFQIQAFRLDSLLIKQEASQVMFLGREPVDKYELRLHNEY